MFSKQKRIIDKKAIKRTRKEWCEVCGSTWMLCSHHIKTKGSGGHDLEDNLICLCGSCHAKVHNGNISKDKLNQIIEGRK